MLIVCDSVRKLKTQDVISVESVTLESVDNDSGLESRLEVSKTQNYFFPGFFLARDKSNSFESEERSEDVCHFSFCSV